MAAEVPASELLGFVELLHDVAERYRGLAEMLDAAETRVMCGVARHCVATEAA